MEDKSLYLSDLSLEMLSVAQKNCKTYLPIVGKLSEVSLQEIHMELYSLATNNIIIQEDEEKFTISPEYVSLFRTLFSAEKLVKVYDCVSKKTISYYPYEGKMVELKLNVLRKRICLTEFLGTSFGEKLSTNLNLPELSVEEAILDGIVLEIESLSDVKKAEAKPEWLNVNPEELISKAEGYDIVGIVDCLRSNSDKNISRTIIYRQSIFYKLITISEDGVQYNNYNGHSFNDIFNRIIGEY